MSDNPISRRDALSGMLAGMTVAISSSSNQAAAAVPAPSKGNKVALEEHIDFPGGEGVIFHPPGIDDTHWRRISERLLDVEQTRLPLMDANGIAMQVVSLTANGIQAEPDPRRAVDLAKAANDWVAQKFVSAHPTRFSAFAAVALQDPQAACKEAQRAIGQLGFKGVLVNGYCNIGDENTGEYLDLPKFAPFWACVQDLGVPVYLHPRCPLPSQRLIYEGHDEMLAAMWGFAAETAGHALRLITSGIFDRYPRQQIILGHLGEGLVAMMARAQRRFEYTPCGKQLNKPLAQYLRDNFYITTSGNFHTPTLNGVITEMGIDRVMFSVDYPYEDMAEGASWFDGCPLQGEAREKVAHLNARRLLKLA
jgi:predicted TIM-barrel fold metal-dependent hydrolase